MARKEELKRNRYDRKRAESESSHSMERETSAQRERWVRGIQRHDNKERIGKKEEEKEDATSPFNMALAI